MVDGAYLKKALDEIGCVFLLAETTSTNDFLLKQKSDNRIQICIASEQTKGKGQFQRQWLAPKNSSLLCSIKHRFDIKTDLSGLSLVIGIAIIKTLEAEYGVKNLKLKWPNDIVYQNKNYQDIIKTSLIKTSLIKTKNWQAFCLRIKAVQIITTLSLVLALIIKCRLILMLILLGLIYQK